MIMSSFMCSPESISDISDYLVKTAMWDEAKLHVVLREENGGNDISPESVFTILFHMNQAALVSCYGLETASKMYDKEKMRYIPKEERAKKSVPVIFKEFECFLYQCMQQGVRGTKIYDVLCDQNMNMAYEVARLNKEYQEANWG